MATFDYDDARATALELLTEFGNALVLVREGAGGVYNPGTGTIDSGVDINLNGTGVLLAFKKNEIDGTTVKATDRKLLYQGDDLQIGDLYNGWRVHEFMNLDPDESGTILTTAQMRK